MDEYISHTKKMDFGGAKTCKTCPSEGGGGSSGSFDPHPPPHSDLASFVELFKCFRDVKASTSVEWFKSYGHLKFLVHTWINVKGYQLTSILILMFFSAEVGGGGVRPNPANPPPPPAGGGEEGLWAQTTNFCFLCVFK